MEKPTLKDYGLTKKTIENHEKQVRKYEIIKKKTEEENKRYNRTLVAYISILVILFLVSLGLILSSFEKPLIPYFVFMVLHTILLAYLLNKDETEIAIIPAIFTALGLSAVMPVIIIGITVYSQRKRTEDYTEKKLRREDYYSIDLEKSIQEYKKANDIYNEWIKTCNRDYWINMSGYEFEDAIAKLYSKQGYYTETTSYSGDGGVDIILTKDDSRIAVQCKHHSKPVGPNDVRALMGVVASQGFDRGIFVSLNGFTQTVKTEVRKSKIAIELVDLNEILSLVQNNNLETKAKKDLNNSTISSFTQAINKTQAKKVCIGNCSTCKREVCIEDNWDS